MGVTPSVVGYEYLDEEEMSPTRHMYCAGMVAGMAGGPSLTGCWR